MAMVRALVTGVSITVMSLCGAVHAQELRIGVGSEATSIDPHFFPLTANTEIARHIFNSLVKYDATRTIVPDLAESWTQVDDSTWEFKLRPGVKFSNGEPLTAEDVVFTFNRIPTVTGSPSNYEAYTKHFTSVEAVDDTTVRLKTNGFFAGTLANLSYITIIPRSLGSSVQTADFNSGKAVIGTGPYKLVEWRQGDQITLTVNDQYWGDEPYWKTVTFRPLTNAAARSAALMTGSVDVVNQVPSSDVESLEANAQTQVLKVPGTRLIGFMIHQPDAALPVVTAKDGSPLDKNPLGDPRVRAAFQHAINRDAIVERVMEGLALKADQFMPPVYVGQNDAIVPIAYDPDKAKALLAEAGYPDGFAISIQGPNNRYLNDEKVIQAVAQMLSRVGIQTKVDTMPAATYFGEAAKKQYAFFLTGLGANELLDFISFGYITSDAAKGVGTYNWGIVNDADMDALFYQASAEPDAAKRDATLKKLEARALNDLHVMAPMFYEMNVWGLKKGLSFEGRFDGETRAVEIRAQ